MSRCALALGLLFATAARAEPAPDPLAAARQAVDTVRYDEAQRLLVEALQAGDLDPHALGEAYRLSAQTAVVLGDAARAEQYDRRWLAIDPHAHLSPDAAPKLRAPFDAARADLAAHGPLTVRARRIAGGVEVTVTNDPLHMATAVRAPAGLAVPLTSDAPARLAPAPDRLVILDDHGNHLLELAVAPDTTPPRRPLIWAVPAIALAGVAATAAVLAIHAQHQADAIAADSSHQHKADADDQVHRARIFTVTSSLAAAGAIGLGVFAVLRF